jgi:hypothetical protein
VLGGGTFPDDRIYRSLDQSPAANAGAKLSARTPLTNMLSYTGNGGDTVVCTSPDLAVGQAAVFFENDFTVAEIGPVLDRLMLSLLRI